MAPAKRKARRKEANGTSDIDLPDSPTSRPSTKKRKATTSRLSQKHRRLTPEPALPDHDDDSDPEDGDSTGNKDLIESVISYLQVANHPVAVVAEHANQNIHDAEKVTAYAKIAGRDWTYFVVGQNVNIGRPPDKDADTPSVPPSSPLADMKDLLPVHIDLGPSKYVSRHHAHIFYDDKLPVDGGWHLRVNGRNGVRVNNHLLKRGERHHLTCGDIIEIAATQMMFVTPADKAIIDPFFVERAKLAASGEDWNAAQHAHPHLPLDSLPSGSLYPSASNPQPLALAPAHFKRAVTPSAMASKDGQDQRSVFDTKAPPSPMYNRGMMMESTQDIDYSQDAAKDLKPPFSYATMIAQAIFSNEEEKLTLSNIYAWISDKYAFYRHSNSGWQNSIRHNLSLNKAFQKVPRRTDEPGKGMKWQIAPEFRADYLKKQAKKGLPPSSSAPNSPAAAAASSKELAPNFRAVNGQNLGFDSRYVSQFPAVNAYQQLPAITPERRSRKNTQTTAPDPDLDSLTSPLPRPALNHQHHQRQHYDMSSSPKQPHYSLPTNTHIPQEQQLSQQSPPQSTTNNDDHPASNPTLSSSYLDTPFHGNQINMITPAPRKLQNIRLAPPSTLVAPSKFMAPDSSPAGPHSFWRGLMSIGGPGSLGMTPAGPVLDMSPVKQPSRALGGSGLGIGAGGGGRSDIRGRGVVEEEDEEEGGEEGDGDGKDPMSSSPPPTDGPGASPTKRTSTSSALRFNASTATRPPPNPDYEMSIATPTEETADAATIVHYPPPPNAPTAAAIGPPLATAMISQDHHHHHHHNDNVDIDVGLGLPADPSPAIPTGGFDLARGFQPIGSFSSSTAAGAGAAAAHQPR